MTAVDMGNAPTFRDYSLTGPSTRRAIQRGLVSGEWYKCQVPRDKMKGLMKRKDGPAIRDTALWFALFAVSGYFMYHFWGSWLALPFTLVYGVLYGSSGDSRWHECGHRTAFKTQWMNDVVYQIASFMILRNPTLWRWSHTRHHTDTYIIGHDPEIVGTRPPHPFKMLGYLIGITDAPQLFAAMFRHASGRLTVDEQTFVPESERSKIYLIARIWVLIYVATLVACFVFRSILPAMFIGLPVFYGAWFKHLVGTPQHVGLSDDVLDHRLNSRTVYMNPLSRFLYWNMNYHVEHHMFPMVPYHALPQLHEAIKDDCPPPYNGLIEAYREIIPTVIRQTHDPEYFVLRPLPNRTTSP
jgi:fatty acid desaturase